MNIPGRNLNTKCITSQTVAYDVMAVGPISEETAEEKQVLGDKFRQS